MRTAKQHERRLPLRTAGQARHKAGRFDRVHLPGVLPEGAAAAVGPQQADTALSEVKTTLTPAEAKWYGFAAALVLTAILLVWFSR